MMKTETVVILALIGVGTVAVLATVAARGAANAAGAVVDYGSGLLTGNNAITQGARTDAYQGWGVVGTLGAATDRLLGGVPSRVGESLGGWLYDITH